jgi:hypothetical protein
MPLPVITNTFRCTVNGHIGNDTSDNVIHLINTTGAGAAASCASDLGSAWITLIQSFDVFSSEYGFDSISVLPLDGSSATTDFVPTGWPGVGSTSDASTPSLVARIITLRTAVGGRSNRGRMYLAGEHVQDVDAESTLWTPTSTANMTTAAEAFRVALSPGSAASQLAVASYKLASSRPVTSCVARQYFGTQRRRARA